MHEAPQGLFAPIDPVQQPAGGGKIRAAAEKTIEAKRAAGLLDDSHELSVQLILEMSSAVDRGLAWGKVSIATTTMAREVRESLAALPSPAHAGGGGWDEIVDDLTDEDDDA